MSKQFPNSLEQFQVLLQPYDGGLINISPLVTGLQIYENIHSPFLEGRISIIDNSNLLGTGPIIGQERIIIVARKGNDTITKEFRVAKLNDANRINENTGSYVLSIVSELAFKNAEIEFSQFMRGLNTDIVKNIADNHLDVSVNILSKGGYNMNVVFPYRKPLEAIEEVLDQTYADDGSPLFFFERFWYGDVVLQSLDDILNESNIIYIDTAVKTVSAEGDAFKQYPSSGQTYDFRIDEAYDSLTALHNGVFAHTVTEADITTRTIDYNQFSFRGNIPTGRDKQEWLVTNFDSQFQSNFRTAIKTTKAYTGLPTPGEAPDFLTSKKDTYKALAGTFSGTIQTTGNLQMCAGRRVRAFFPKFFPRLPAQGDLDYDEYNSGEFAIAGLNHVFSWEDGRLVYEISAELIRNNIGSSPKFENDEKSLRQ